MNNTKMSFNNVYSVNKELFSVLMITKYLKNQLSKIPSLYINIKIILNRNSRLIEILSEIQIIQYSLSQDNFDE